MAFDTRLCLTLIAALAATTCASAALAAPDRPAQAPCTGAAPAPGASFSGPVMQVIDGDRLCVAAGPTPDQWVEVRPAGLIKAAGQSPRAARSAMLSATFAKRLDCVAGDKAGGAVTAVCALGGARLSDEVEAAQDDAMTAFWR